MIPVEETLRGLSDALSLRARVRYLVQLFGAGAVALLVGVLWWTEDGLPVRTQIGFGGVIAVGIGWMVYAAHALRRRGRLFAIDRVLAGWVALGFALLLATGIVLVGDWPVRVLGGVLVVAAAGLLSTAHANRRRLQVMRQQLERPGSGQKEGHDE